jgi:zinc protease
MKLQNSLILAVLCLLSASFSVTHAQQLQLDPQVTTGKLKNGFTYYIRKNTVQKGRVTLFLANKVGSILETEEQRGLAHFMEHMSFNGTKHFPASAMIDFLEKAGVRFGADLNAYTNYDETVYQLPVPIDKPEMLKSGLQVIRDWAQDATLDPKEIDKERGVILEEKRMRDGAGQRFQDQYFPILVNRSRYAQRSPIGTEEVLKSFSYETIQGFYKDWYRPNLQAIIVVGDVDPIGVKLMIEDMFSDLVNPLSEKPRAEYPIRLKGKNNFMALTDKEAPNTSLRIYFKHPHRKLLSAADYRNFLINNLVNQLLAKRFQSISQKNAENYMLVNAGIGPFLDGIDAFTLLLVARPGELEKGFVAMWSEINNIKQAGFTPAELESVKTSYLLGTQAMLKEQANTQSAQYAQEYTSHFLHAEAAPGIIKEAELTAGFMPGIKLSEINASLKSYITEKNRDIIITAPEQFRASIPDEQKMNTWLSPVVRGYVNATPVKGEQFSGVFQGQQAGTLSTTGQTVNISKGQPVTTVMQTKPKQEPELPKGDLLDRLPEKGHVVSTSRIEKLNITELKLSNGVRVIMKPTNFKNDEIGISAYSPGGTSLYSDKDYMSALNASSAAIVGGLGHLSAEQLREKLNGKQASASPFVAERIEGINGGSNAADLETMLQLFYAYFTTPRKDSAAFSAALSRTKATLANPVLSADKVFADTVNAVLSNYHLRRKSVGLAEIQQVSYDKAFEIYQDRFKDASDFTFIIVGSFDPLKIQPLLERYLGGLPAIGRKETAKDLGINIPKGNIKKNIYSGAMDRAQVRMLISGDFEYSAENSLKMNAISKILGFKMIQRLREQESGVYSPGVGLAATKSPRPTYAFSISFSCLPANAEKLIAAAKEEIAKLKANGPSQDDLVKFLAEERVAIKNAMETNAFWLRYLSNQYQENLDPQRVLEYDALLDTLNTTLLKDAVNLYLDQKNYIELVLLPEKTTK